MALSLFTQSHVHRHTPVIMHNFTLCHEQVNYNSKVLLGPFSLTSIEFLISFNSLPLNIYVVWQLNSS